MAAEPFAGVSDYAARYGEPEDSGRIGALLADASAMLRSAFRRRAGEAYCEGISDDFDENVGAVCCAMVFRATRAGDMAGASQMSQAAGDYSASVTFANPTGDLYMTAQDLQRLGLGGCGVWTISPQIGD